MNPSQLVMPSSYLILCRPLLLLPATLNITIYQNHNEKSPHTHQNGYYQKSKQKKQTKQKTTSVKEDVEKLES